MREQEQYGKCSSVVLPYMLLASLVMIVYGGTLRAEFIYDDHTQLVENVALRSLRNIPTFFTDPARTSGSMIFEEIFRPLRATVFSLEYQLWGFNAAGYHAVNVVFHMLNSFLVFLFLLRIFSAPTPALAAALLFAAHPALTENVCWVCSRSDLLCMFFYLIGLLCFFGSRNRDGNKRRILFMISLVALALAMLSKEMGVTFPAAIVAIDIWREGFKRQSPRRWLEYAPFILVTLVYLIFRATMMSHFAQRPPWGETPFATAAIMAKGMVYYIRLLLYPFKLTVLPFIDLNVSPVNAETALAIGFIIVLIGAAFAFRRRFPMASLGIILFFILLLPVSNIVPIKAVVGDRFIYLPSLGFIIMAAALFRVLMPSEARLSRRHAAIAGGAVTLLVFLYSVNTIVRSIDWRNDFSLFRSAVEAEPRNIRARAMLGKEYFFREDYEAAREQCLLALQDNPRSSEAHTLLGGILLREGFLGQAEKEFRMALETDATSGDALNGLGIVYQKQGRLDEAQAAFMAALENNPVVSELLNNVGSVLLEKGEAASALEYFTRALKVKPDNQEAAYNKAFSLIELHRYADAVDLIEGWLSWQPADAEMLLLLGRAFAGGGDYEAAVEACSRAIALDPSDVRALIHLADLHMDYGKYKEAASVYQGILARYPTAVAHRVSLASALEKMGMLEAAIKELHTAIRLNPRDASARDKLADILAEAGSQADAKQE